MDTEYKIIWKIAFRESHQSTYPRAYGKEQVFNLFFLWCQIKRRTSAVSKMPRGSTSSYCVHMYVKHSVSYWSDVRIGLHLGTIIRQDVSCKRTCAPRVFNPTINVTVYKCVGKTYNNKNCDGAVKIRIVLIHAYLFLYPCRIVRC